MGSTNEHYDSFLADHYSWLFGGLSLNCQENKDFFLTHNIKPRLSGIAVDLGCGSGFQSIPLAQIGFTTISIDTNKKLLGELNENKDELSITTAKDNLLNFKKYCPDNIELCVCMGDVLTHLESFEEIKELFNKIFQSLETNGCFILTFRDLTKELQELDRFIPVNNDETKIFTCFLEYEKDKVKVHDLLYEKENDKWDCKKSFYKKLRVPYGWTLEKLKTIGFNIKYSNLENGLITIIAVK
jgi:SAM-dependent methyltransferase